MPREGAVSAPYVNIELDGKKKLRYRHNDMADLEVMTGKSFGELLTGSQFHGLRVVLHFGLKWNETKMSPAIAGDLIQDHWIAKGKKLEELAAVILDALRAGGLLPAAPTVVEDEGDSGNAPPDAT
jgi:hypothetical protein